MIANSVTGSINQDLFIASLAVAHVDIESRPFNL